MMRRATVCSSPASSGPTSTRSTSHRAAAAIGAWVGSFPNEQATRPCLIAAAMKRARLLLALLPLALRGAALLFWRSQPREVRIGTAHWGAATELAYATGFVEAEQPVSVASRLTAPVSQVLVDEGDRVRRGQPLVRLEDDEQRGLLAQAPAAARRTSLAEGRVLTLHREGWVARAARDEAVAAAASARAAERSASARVQQLVVRAGIDGIVLTRDVENGDLAIPTRVLLSLGDTTLLRVTAH